ncbi:hypothetical protein NMY22_g4363 [Coprinellus aureogranulatus]|nr:hypothetical protein NMY22_g4363 [Coprinellus aureogranulatus]
MQLLVQRRHLHLHCYFSSRHQAHVRNIRDGSECANSSENTFFAELWSLETVNSNLEFGLLNNLNLDARLSMHPTALDSATGKAK